MTNVKAETKGDLLILTIDCGATAKANAWKKEGGKLNMIASTHGFTSINGVSVSVNAGLKTA